MLELDDSLLHEELSTGREREAALVRELGEVRGKEVKVRRQLHSILKDFEKETWAKDKALLVPHALTRCLNLCIEPLHCPCARSTTQPDTTTHKRSSNGCRLSVVVWKPSGRVGG